MESPEVNKTMTFIAFEWIDSEILTLTADTEDSPEFSISKETLKIALQCTETEEVEECLLRKLPLRANINFRNERFCESQCAK